MSRQTIIWQQGKERNNLQVYTHHSKKIHVLLQQISFYMDFDF